MVSFIGGENHQTATSHWQNLPHNVVLRKPRLGRIRTQNVSGDRNWLHMYLSTQVPYAQDHDGSLYNDMKVLHTYHWYMHRFGICTYLLGRLFRVVRLGL